MKKRWTAVVLWGISNFEVSRESLVGLRIDRTRSVGDKRESRMASAKQIEKGANNGKRATVRGRVLEIVVVWHLAVPKRSTQTSPNSYPRIW